MCIIKPRKIIKVSLIFAAASQPAGVQCSLLIEVIITAAVLIVVIITAAVLDEVIITPTLLNSGLVY